MLADQYSDPLAAMLPQERQQLAMPEREDHALSGRARGEETRVVHRTHAPRHREQANEGCARTHDPADAGLAHDGMCAATPAGPRARSSAIPATRSAAPGAP